jgi:hypothetical protein
MGVDKDSKSLPTYRRLFWLLAVLMGVAIFVETRDEKADDEALALPMTHGHAAAVQQPGMLPAAIGDLHAAHAARREQLAGSLARALEVDAKTVDWPSLPEAARRSWEAVPTPSSPTVQAASDPAPAPPEVPFQWIGLWEQPSAASGVPAARVAIISLSRGTRLAHAGDVLEDDWKVDRISGDQIQLTYLPLRVRQTLAMNNK